MAPRRALTTTPLQALALMNGTFVLRMADRFAERLKKDAGNDVAKQIARAWTFDKVKNIAEHSWKLPYNPHEPGDAPAK